MSWDIRRAEPRQSDEIAALYRRVASREWDFLYPHTPEEDRAFYRRRGFAEALFTDGAANEEKEPDVLLEWWRR